MTEDTKQVDVKTVTQNVETNVSDKVDESQVNWKKFREEREKERKALMEAQESARKKHEEAEALKKAMEALVNKPVQQPVYEDTEEDRIKKLIAEEVKKDREIFLKEQRERESADLPNKIRKEYSDFDQVCSDENIDYLEYHHPEMYEAFKEMPDSYKKYASIYKAVKKYVKPEHRADSNKIAQNQSKPQASPPSIADRKPQNVTPFTTEQQRQEKWKEMWNAMHTLS